MSDNTLNPMESKTAFLLYLVLYFAVNGGIKIFSRMLRTINVLSRGWPPTHLDADGDWKDAGRKEVNPIESQGER